ncbi:hypothetical protein DFH27DRAFT_201190 [Peziza echinospora]|nr:hypothetical protein DFH27DRAFT_201190 [Peziza echinospora]
MPPTMGLFSRRKHTEDKALRNMLATVPVYEAPPISRPADEVPLSPTSIPHLLPVAAKRSALPKLISSSTSNLVSPPSLIARVRNDSTTSYSRAGATGSARPHTAVSSRPATAGSDAPPQSFSGGILRSKSASKLMKRSKEEKQNANRISFTTGFVNLEAAPSAIAETASPPSKDSPRMQTYQNTPMEDNFTAPHALGSLSHDFSIHFPPFASPQSPGDSPRSRKSSFAHSPYISSHGANSTPQSPVTPPLSPESPAKSQNIGNVTPLGIFGGNNDFSGAGSNPPLSPLVFRKKKSENDLILEIASLKKTISHKDELLQRLDPNFLPESQPHESPKEAKRITQILAQRIRDLERINHEKDETLARHTPKLHAMRQNHNAMIETLRISHEAEIGSLRETISGLEKAKAASMEERRYLWKREQELSALLNERGEELESLRKDTNEMRGKVIFVEKLLAQREGELEIIQRQMNRMSRLTTRTSIYNEEDEEMRLQLEEEIRRREDAEKELDEIYIKNKATLEDAISRERENAKEELEQRLEEERRKRDDYKTKLWKDVDEAIAEEERRRQEAVATAEQELSSRLLQEEKRRAELAAGFTEKLEILEQARKADQDDFESRLKARADTEEGLIRHNNELQARVNELQDTIDRDQAAIVTLKASHEDIMRVAKRINERLGEEKRRNRRLEHTVRSNSQVSHRDNVTSPRPPLGEEAMQLQLQLDDREAKIGLLSKELDAWKLELKTVDEAWRKVDAESKKLQEILTERETRMKYLEAERSRLVDAVKLYRTQFTALQKKARRASSNCGCNLEELQSDLAHFIENSAAELKAVAIEDANRLEQSKGTDGFERLQLALAEAEKEIALYKLDLRGYRKDIRRRDAQIVTLSTKVQQLEENLKQQDLELHSLQDELQIERRLPQPPKSTFQTNNENIQVLAGKISSVKDENLQLKQRVRVHETEYNQCLEEKEALRKKLQRFTEQQGMVISELELKLERVTLEKEVAEEKARRAIRNAAVVINNSAVDDIPEPTTEYMDVFVEGVLAAVQSPPLPSEEIEFATIQDKPQHIFHQLQPPIPPVEPTDVTPPPSQPVQRQQLATPAQPPTRPQRPTRPTVSTSIPLRHAASTPVLVGPASAGLTPTSGHRRSSSSASRTNIARPPATQSHARSHSRSSSKDTHLSRATPPIHPSPTTPLPPIPTSRVPMIGFSSYATTPTTPQYSASSEDDVLHHQQHYGIGHARSGSGSSSLLADVLSPLSAFTTQVGNGGATSSPARRRWQGGGTKRLSIVMEPPGSPASGDRDRGNGKLPLVDLAGGPCGTPITLKRSPSGGKLRKERKRDDKDVKRGGSRTDQSPATPTPSVVVSPRGGIPVFSRRKEKDKEKEKEKEREKEREKEKKEEKRKEKEIEKEKSKAKEKEKGKGKEKSKKVKFGDKVKGGNDEGGEVIYW